MTLIEPAWVTFWNQYRTYIIAAGLALIVVGLIFFLVDWGGNAWFKSKLQKDKDAIKAETNQIANITNRIQQLEKDKVAVQSNINAATEELQKNIFGLDAAKTETNQALANLQRAVNSNSNVDRTVEDMNRILDKLDDMDK